MKKCSVASKAQQTTGEQSYTLRVSRTNVMDRDGWPIKSGIPNTINTSMRQQIHTHTHRHKHTKYCHSVIYNLRLYFTITFFHLWCYLRKTSNRIIFFHNLPFYLREHKDICCWLRHTDPNLLILPVSLCVCCCCCSTTKGR